MDEGRHEGEEWPRRFSHEFVPGRGNLVELWVGVGFFWLIAALLVGIGILFFQFAPPVGWALMAMAAAMSALGVVATIRAATIPRRRVHLDGRRCLIFFEHVVLQRFFVPRPKRRLVCSLDEIVAVRLQSGPRHFSPTYFLDIYTLRGCVRVDSWLSGFDVLSTSLLKLAGDRPVPMMHRPMFVIGLVGLCIGGLTVVVCLALGWP